MSNRLDRDDMVAIVAIGLVVLPIVGGLTGLFILEALKTIYGR